MSVVFPREELTPPMFFITQYVGSGTDEDPYRPRGVDGLAQWSSIDLSPDGAKGDVLVAAPEQLPVAAGRDLLSDDPAAVMPLLVRNKLGNRLGLSLATTKLADVVAELLIDHAREDGTRWRPASPEADGALRIYLGGLLWEMFPIRGGASIADDFDRGDNSNLSSGAPFGWTELQGNFSIVSNRIRGETLNASHMARADSDLGSGDHFAEIDIVSISGTGTTNRNEPGTVVRHDGNAALTHYIGRVTKQAAASTGWRLQKSEAGTVTTLTESLNVALPATPFKIRTEANGSTIRVLEAPSTEKLSVTDTAISGTGRLRTGVKTTLGTSATKEPMDNFAAGDLGPPTHELPRAAEADSARVLSVSKTANLPRPTTTDAARELTVSKTVVLPRATETDAARGLSAAKSVTLPRALGADAARPLSAAKSVVLPRALETDTARALGVIVPAVYVLPRAVETSAARELSVAQVAAAVAMVSRRRHEPKIPRVHCRLDSRSIGLDDWLATTIANGGCDTLRGVAVERVMRRYSSSFEQGAPIRLVLDSGRIIWEGELDSNPLPYNGLVALNARGPFVWAEEMEDPYLAQSRDTGLFTDEASSPYNGSPAAGISVSVEDGALHWQVAKDTVLNSGAGGTSAHAHIIWIQGSLARRLQGSIYRDGTTTHWQIRVHSLTGPAGARTQVGSVAVGPGTLVDVQPTTPEDAMAVELYFNGPDGYIQPDDLSVYLRDVRVHDIALTDSFTVTDAFADAGRRLGYDTQAIPVGPPGPRSASPAISTSIYLVTKGLVFDSKWKPPPLGGRPGLRPPIKIGPDVRRLIGSINRAAIQTSPLNILPLAWGGRWGGNWAGMFDHLVEMLDWRWRIAGNHYGRGPVVDVGPWGPSHDVRVRKNVVPNLSSVVLHTRVEVVYTTADGGLAKVVRTKDPDPLAHRGRRPRVHKFVLADVQKDGVLATQTADTLLQQLGGPRQVGSLQIVGIHGEADETLYDAQGGDLVTIGDLGHDSVQPLRIAQTEMSKDGVTAGIGQPATVEGAIALAEAGESRRPYGTIVRARDVRTSAQADRIPGFKAR